MINRQNKPPIAVMVTLKRVTSGDDTLDLNIPRDRDAAFEPQLIPKGVRQFDGFDDKVISLYARGMTQKD